ncbi:hypothetical protein KHP60_12355 [Microvirga sp. 3-52]|uniref:hypothetical protein n=1 Tax=Microvirga sp. 3-52 TaxID=2792425 RepID=UPI001ACBABB7|nr:hypothetical protein [Microvirga sp. 3-52]MBO1905780.1 hypothetical protein [Microvirga sp. 3-52]MBS7453123.1 hypothetical protein [Microvirga sp. 3-52]
MIAFAGRLGRSLYPYGSFVAYLCLIAAAAPFALSYHRAVPAWDELFFLHNAVCVNQAVLSGSIPGLDACFAELAKSPLMALALIPAGPLHGNPGSLGLASVVLALAMFGVAIGLGHMASRLKVPVWAVALVSVSILMTPSILGAGAPLLADGILAFIVACTLLLPVLETQRETANAWSRGVSWGVLFGLGATLKLSYLFFAGPVFLLTALLSFRRVGLRTTVFKILVAVLVASPALLVLARYGRQYLQHAQNFSFGSLAEYYTDGVSRWLFVSQQLDENAVPLLIMAVFGGAAVWRWRHDPVRVATGLTVAGMAVLFDFVAAGSPNKDLRFFWPVWVSLPMCFAAAIPPRTSRSSVTRSSAAIGWAMAVAVLLSLPMHSRMDLRAVEQARAALELAQQNGAKSFGIAADTAAVNVETFILAWRLNRAQFGDMRIFTVVYDVMQGKDAQTSLARLTSADVAAFFQPNGSSPEWANRNFPEFVPQLTSPQREVINPPGAGPIRLSFPRH